MDFGLLHFVLHYFLIKIHIFMIIENFQKKLKFQCKTPQRHTYHQKPKKVKKKFFVQNGPNRRENRFKNLLEKKVFFLGLGRFFEVDLGQKKVKNFFFIFRLQMAQFVQKTGLEKNLRLFVKKHQTLDAYNSANTHPNIFWTTFLELESKN